MRVTAKKITITACMSALSLIAFAIESLLPPLFLPFCKLGISNVFILLSLICLSPAQAYITMIVKCVLGNLIVGNLSTMIYSLTAGMVSLTVMVLLYVFLKKHLSVLCISIVSAITHNLVQNLVFCLITQTPKMFVYMPYLALLGILSGAIVGLAVELIIRKLPISFFDKTLNINSKVHTKEETNC